MIEFTIGWAAGWAVGILLLLAANWWAKRHMARQQAPAQEARLAREAQALQEATDARRAVVEASIIRMAGWVTSMPLDKLLHLEDGLHELEFTELQAVRRWWEGIKTHPEWFQPLGIQDYDERLQVFYALFQEAYLFFTRPAKEA